MEGEGPMGTVWYCPVAAAGVGDIRMNILDGLWNKETKKFEKREGWNRPETSKIRQGEEIGLFRLGSTVVLLVEVPVGFQFSDIVGKKVRYGDVIGRAV